MVYLDVVLAEFLDSLGFGQAYSADFWVGEDDGGDVCVVEFCGCEMGTAGRVVGAEEAVGESAAGCYCDCVFDISLGPWNDT